MTIANLDEIKFPVDSLVLNFNNTSDKEATYGDWFSIQTLDADGEWHEVRYDEKYRNRDNEICIVFSLIAYVQHPNSTGTKVEKPWMYGDSIRRGGRYRIAKDFWLGKYTGRVDTVYAEFTLSHL